MVQPRRPVSAEDFAPDPNRRPSPEDITDQYISFWKGVGNAVNPMNLVRAVAHPIDTAKHLYDAQAAEFDKADKATTPTEATAHFVAGLLPVVGPAAAAAGEQIASGDVSGGIGSGAGLIGSMAAPRVVPKAVRATIDTAPALATIGEQLASKGKALAPVAKEASKIAALEGAAHYVGLPPAVTSLARYLVRDKLGKSVAQESLPPPLRMHGPEIEASLRGTVSPPLAPHGPDVSPNFGGTVAGTAKAADINTMLADSLAEIAAKKDTPRITTPPQPDLPPNYTPRTSAPKPKEVRASATVNPRGSAAERARLEAAKIGQKNYFLRKPEATTDAAPTTPDAAPIRADDLPVELRKFTQQDLGKNVPTADLVKALSEEMSKLGLSPDEVMADITRRKDLPPALRIQAFDALNRTRRMLKVAK